MSQTFPIAPDDGRSPENGQLSTARMGAQLGFTLTRVIAVGIVLVFGCLIGWLVYRHRRTVTRGATRVLTVVHMSAPPDGPYAGWKTATLKYERLTFEYPPNWRLTNVSYAAGSNSVTCSNPGKDSASLVTPNNETLFLDTGSGCQSLTARQIASVPVSVLGQTDYLSIADNDRSSSDNGQPTEACLSTSPTSFAPPLSRNVQIDPGFGVPAVNDFCLTFHLLSNFVPVHKTVAAVESDPSLATAKLVFESFRY